ncbi:hypothetical protein PAXRUDRAFT_834784 [Paxillus rubicundulus Ve08.2h10]|uniref:Uncharacterized protein n=1 Tax=Paxillus rubicundulus Ve08.2h10 TaxID=930991 RepID=A0A0D0D344_9AGAM|nr:hypothetical protein PAXRUDRAFT_834784 [Paxillus rubicundulus Ve08.2h10]
MEAWKVQDNNNVTATLFYQMQDVSTCLIGTLQNHVQCLIPVGIFRLPTCTGAESHAKRQEEVVHLHAATKVMVTTFLCSALSSITC